MNDNKLTLKNYIALIIKAIFASFALTRGLVYPLEAAAFGEKIDFITASIYQLLGDFNFSMIIIAVIVVFALAYALKKGLRPQMGQYVLGAFFGLCVVVGESLLKTGSFIMIYGSLICFIVFAIRLCGYTVMFATFIDFISACVKKKELVESKVNNEDNRLIISLFSGNIFLKVFFVLFAFYGLIIIICYPGNLCWDSIGQILQVDEMSFKAHHPVFHTLIMGGLVKFGKTLLGSQEIGLFLYMLVQSAMLSAAFAYTISVLKKSNVKARAIFVVFCLYIITPIYSNLVSTAIKDIPFVAACIVYMTCYAQIVADGSKIQKIDFSVLFVISAILTILFRNNGIYMVLISGLILSVQILISKKANTSGYDWKIKLRTVLVAFILPVVIGFLLTSLLNNVTNAKKGGIGEALSLPMQITARYLGKHEAELTDNEKSVLTNVFGEDLVAVADAYIPELSDPVKAFYRTDASMSDTISYIKVWAADFVKDPILYIETACMHFYGWFDPEISTSIRYETTYEDIYTGGIINGMSKVVLFIYRFVGKTPLDALQNVGIATWALLLLSYLLKNKRGNVDRKRVDDARKDIETDTDICYQNKALALVPLYACLLICMAAPGFLQHPRYGLPIMAMLPFLYCYLLENNKSV